MFSVKHQAIWCLAKNVIRESISVTEKLIFVSWVKKSFARGTLFAPIQLPKIPLAVSWIPKATMISNSTYESKITCAACCDTLKVPAIKTRISKAQTSAQYIAVTGSATWRYSHQPRKVSLSGKVIAGLMFLEQLP